MVAFRQTINAFLTLFVAFSFIGLRATPVEDFFKTAHREAWNAHLSRIVNDSNSPKWVKTGCADGKFETSIWEYIPDVAFDYSTKTEGYFKSDDWVSLDKLDEAITESLNKAACRGKDIYECYSGANWNALLFRNFVYRVLNPKEKFKADNCLKILEKTCASLVEQDLFEPHKKMLEAALRDIKIYVRDLKLAEYLCEMKKIIWSEKYRDRLYSTSRSKFSKPVKIAPGVSGDFYFDNTFQRYAPKKSVSNDIDDIDISDSSESEDEVYETTSKILCGYIRFDDYSDDISKVPTVSTLDAVRDKKPFVFEKWFLGEASKSYFIRANDDSSKSDTFYPMEFDFRTMAVNVGELKSFAKNTFKQLPLFEQIKNVKTRISACYDYDRDLKKYNDLEYDQKQKLQKRLRVRDILAGKDPNISIHVFSSIFDWICLFTDVKECDLDGNYAFPDQVAQTFCCYCPSYACHNHYLAEDVSELADIPEKVEKLTSYHETLLALSGQVAKCKSNEVRLPKYITEKVNSFSSDKKSAVNENEIMEFARVCKIMLDRCGSFDCWEDNFKRASYDLEMDDLYVDVEPAKEAVHCSAVVFCLNKFATSLNERLQVYKTFIDIRNERSKNVNLQYCNGKINFDSGGLSVYKKHRYCLTQTVKKELDRYLSDKSLATLQKKNKKPDAPELIPPLLVDIASKLKILGINCDDVSFDTSKTKDTSKAKYKVFQKAMRTMEDKIQEQHMSLQNFLNTKFEAEACEYALQRSGVS